MGPVIVLSQKNIIRFLLLEISLTSIKFYIVQGIPGGYLYNGIANIVISLVLILFLIPSYLSALKECQTGTVAISIMFFFTIIFQMVLFPSNVHSILSNIVKMIGMSFGCLISANALRDFNTFYMKLAKISKVIICFAAFEFVTHTFMGVTGSDITVDYDMSFGFFLVVPTVTQFSEICSYKEKKIYDWFFFLIGFLMALMMGSRGSILAICVGCILSFYEKSKMRSRKHFSIVIMSFIFVILLYLNYKKISVSMYNLLLSYGIKSRLLSMLAYGSITYSAGRDEIQIAVMNMIHQHPILGSGMLSYTGSHSIIYEVILFYGYPIGILILVILVFQCIKCFFEKDFYKRKLMAIFLSYALVDSLLNLTVLGKDIFWIYLGLALSTKLLRRRY